MTTRAGRPCRACTHPDRAAIDAALVAGTALTTISANSGISPQSLLRHRDAHLPQAALEEAEGARTVAETRRGRTLLQDVTDLHREALTILRQAKAAGALGTALAAIREACRTIELAARLTGELNRQADPTNPEGNPYPTCIEVVFVDPKAPTIDAVPE